MASDVHALFQTHTIEGIKKVENQIRSDIEKKKQELRVLVGERYRDLINAADTIQDMEKASNEVFSGINKVSELCSEFSPGLVDKGAASKQSSGEGSEQAFYSLATQMDLLVDTPEKVWSALDKHQYLQASQLYLLSQHIVDNTLHINTGSSRLGINRDVYASFPIVHHQWAAISHFKPSILKGARSSLKDGTLPDKALAESLCCITLLDNFSPRQVFLEFLAARKSAIQDVFQPSLYSTSVKKQVCDITHLVKLTFEQIHTMFYTNEKESPQRKENPLFYSVLHSLIDENASVFQSLFEGDVDIITLSRYLPPLVSGFVPKLQSVPVSISVSYIQKHATEWLEGCIKDVHAGVRKILSYVKNIKGLASIRNAVHDLLKEKDLNDSDEFDVAVDGKEEIQWNNYCNICVNRNFSIWDEFFRPLFLERIQSILENEFDTSFKNLNESLSGVLNSLSDPDNKIDDSCWDHDVSSFLWKEFSQDASSLVSDKGLYDDTLTLKVKGFTPAVKRLCMILNEGLNHLINDVKYFICKEIEENEEKSKGVRKDVQKLFLATEKTLDGPFDKYADASIVKENMYDICNSKIAFICKSIHNLLNGMSDMLLEEKSSSDPVSITAELDKVTFLARFCLSVPDMCYIIQKIVDYDVDVNALQFRKKHPRQLNRKQHPKQSKRLDALQNQFIDQCNHGFDIWENWMCKMCHESISNTLNSKDDLFLFSMTNWENVDIEEESEHGEKVKSSIRVPAQISFYLSSLLCCVAEEFHRVGGNLMDKESMNKMSLHIGLSIFKSHKLFISKSENSLFQNQAFQMMFDLKFISKIFGGNFDHKHPEWITFNNCGNDLIAKLELSIDPFDLDVVVPHINNFVLKQIQTTGLLYGSISNIDKHTIQGHKRSLDLSEQHSIVQLVTHPPRFMLLPLSSAGHSRVTQDSFQIAPSYFDYDTSPLFLHQFQSTISGIV